MFYEGNSHTTILLGIEDVTARRRLEREREDILRKLHALLREKDVLLEELEHRVGTSVSVTHATFAKMPHETAQVESLQRPTSIRGHA